MLRVSRELCRVSKDAFRWELRRRVMLSKIAGHPYSPLVDRTRELKVCAGCYCRMLHMKKCSGCRTVRYCCKRCQRADWSSHKRTCDPDACLPLGTIGIPYPTIPTKSSSISTSAIVMMGHFIIFASLYFHLMGLVLLSRLPHKCDSQY